MVLRRRGRVFSAAGRLRRHLTPWPSMSNWTELLERTFEKAILWQVDLPRSPSVSMFSEGLYCQHFGRSVFMALIWECGASRHSIQCIIWLQFLNPVPQCFFLCCSRNGHLFIIKSVLKTIFTHTWTRWSSIKPIYLIYLFNFSPVPTVLQSVTFFSPMQPHVCDIR